MELSNDLMLTGVLGGIALYIAYQQWRTNQGRVESEQRDRDLKRKYDLFDRRWEIFVGVGAFLDAMSLLTMARSVAAQQVPQKDDFEIQELAWKNLTRLMMTAQFLFERDVYEYLEELNTRCWTLLKMKRRCLDHDDVLPTQGVDESDWLSNDQRFRDLKQKFEYYLRLS